MCNLPATGCVADPQSALLLLLLKKNPWEKKRVRGGKKGFIWLTIPGYSPLWAGEVKTGTQVADPISPPQSRVGKHKYIQSICLTQLAFSLVVMFWTPYLGNGATHNGLGLSTSLNNQDSLL